MKNTNISVQVLVNGKPVKKYGYKGKTYIEAKKGTEYSLRVSNSNSYRVMVATSVDGLDVITGEHSSGDNDGYIIDAYSSIVISGFRVDEHSVGCFKFCHKEESYCNENEETVNNNGVIGFRIFREQLDNSNLFEDIFKNVPKDKNPPPYIPPVNPYPHYPSIPYPIVTWRDGTICGSDASNEVKRSITESNVELSSCQPFDVGTTWGSKKDDNIKYVEFTKGDLVYEDEIFYMSKQALIEYGVPIKNEKQITHPTAFKKFAKPPKNWQSES